MRSWIFVFAAACALFAGSQATAQPALSNPFASAEVLLTERGGATNATFRARYSVDERNPAPTHKDVTIEAGPDWALVHNGEIDMLYDFKLGRVLIISGDAFSSMNLIAPVMFRVIERQNRDYLQGVYDIAGNHGDMPEPCDAELELGVVIPGLSHPGANPVALQESRGTVTALCGRRTVQILDLGDSATPPPSFWPVLASTFPFHPLVMTRAKASGHAPRRIHSDFRNAAPLGSDATLIAVEAIDEPFPLNEAMHNFTAQTLDQTMGQGFAQIATDAVAGRAPNGPSLEAWSEYVRRTAAHDGDASAAVLLNVTLNAYPALGPNCPNTVGACEPINNIRSIVTRKPEVRGFLEMIATEQRHDFPSGVTARATLKGTSIEHHPAVDAAFALILLEGGDTIVQQARAAGLPTDARALQLNAIRGYPYNPAYWTDLGDQHARDYDYPSAFMLYEIAYSLPVPGAHAGVPNDRDGGAQRIRHDFPQFFLP